MTDAPAPLAGIVFPKNFPVDALIAALAADLATEGARVAGVIQETESRAEGRCDALVLRDTGDGAAISITEDRGVHATGCRLDPRGLAEVAARLEAALDSKPDLLVLNRFGKAEAEGGGLRAVLTMALMRGIPVLTAVRDLNVAGWREFHQGMARDLPPSRAALDEWVAEWRAA